MCPDRTTHLFVTLHSGQELEESLRPPFLVSVLWFIRLLLPVSLCGFVRVT